MVVTLESIFGGVISSKVKEIILLIICICMCMCTCEYVYI